MSRVKARSTTGDPVLPDFRRQERCILKCKSPQERKQRNQSLSTALTAQAGSNNADPAKSFV